MPTAIAYLRTSSPTNAGYDKDSPVRQRAAIEAYAARNDIEIVREYHEIIKGEDQLHERSSFMAMIEYMQANDIKMLLVENAGRFARALVVQEMGFKWLQSQEIILIAVDHPESFTDDSPTAVLIRQVMGAIAEFEKSTIVAKLKGARDRKRARTGRCEGRKPAPDAARCLASHMREQGASLREISRELALHGYLAKSGNPYLPTSISLML